MGQAERPPRPIDDGSSRPHTQYRDSAEHMCELLDTLQTLGLDAGDISSTGRMIRQRCLPAFEVDAWFWQESAAALAAVQLDAVRSNTKVVSTAKIVSRDLLILACARGIPSAELRRPRIKGALLERLHTACNFRIEDDEGLWSRLGHSKRQLFPPEEQCTRRQRRGRGRRPNRQAWEAAAEPAEEPVGDLAGELPDQRLPEEQQQQQHEPQREQQQGLDPKSLDDGVLSNQLDDITLAPWLCQTEPEPEDPTMPKARRGSRSMRTSGHPV